MGGNLFSALYLIEKNPGWETPRKETFYVKSDTKD